MSNSRENRRLLYERLIGQTVGGRYEIVSLMGFGGMGAVYEAVQRNMNRRVALKYIPSHDPITAARFEREALTVSQLHHPNTVTVFDFGQTNDGFLYLSMELLSGQPLTDLIKNESPLSPARTVHIASQICRSLAEAHQMGIVHRDIKPDNIILIDVDGDPDVVKVLDFGIAKAVSGEDDVQLTGADRIIGTPRYMSPEQILSGEVDHRSDIYSLGCIIFEMLCGAPPFKASNTTALMISHAQDAPPPFAERLPEEALDHVPLAIEQVVRQTLSKNPADRPQNTDELRRLLQESIQDPPGVRPAHIISSPTSAAAALPHDSQASTKPSGPTKALLAALVLLFVLVLGLTAFILIQSDQPSSEAPAPTLQTEVLPPPEEPAPTIIEEEIPTEIPLNDEIQIRLVTDPPGASVFQNQELLGTTPFEISVSSETDALQYSLRAEGYRSRDVILDIDVEPGQNQAFSFQLDPKPPAQQSPRTAPRREPVRSPAPPPEPEPEPAEEEVFEEPSSRPPAVQIIDDPDSPVVPRVDRL